MVHTSKGGRRSCMITMISSACSMMVRGSARVDLVGRLSTLTLRKKFLRGEGVTTKQFASASGRVGDVARMPVRMMATNATTQPGSYKLPDLPYDYGALEPFIDTTTMKLHHDGHHGTYVSKLNEATKDKGELKGVLLHELQKSAIQMGAAVRNNGGGHYNHSLFWTLMAPKRGEGSREPSGKLKADIEKAFGSYEQFQTAFNGACAGVFGSGWVWLGATEDGGLSIETTANQDNPLMEGVVLSKNTASGERVPHTGGKSKIIPFMGQDVWEHAYYVKYHNRKTEYFSAWWNVLNWDKIGQYYEKYAAKGEYVPFDLY